MKREDIVLSLQKLVGQSNVYTDLPTLQEFSRDRFLKYPAVHGIYLAPLAAALVKAESKEDIVKVLKFANEHKINVVPRTGGTATEGGLECGVADSIVLDASSMKKIIKIDGYNMQATAQCGVVLEVLEEEARKQGLTTGHSPQSKPQAQMGGLVATRSIGQFSTLYGGMEDMLVGVEVVFPDGRVARIKNVPRRAAGPDLRHIVLGNEGTLCFITEVTVKLYKYMPENHRFYGYLVDDFHTAVDILREVAVSGYKPSVCRAYSEEDARQHFSAWHQGKSVLIFLAEGPAGMTKAMGEEIETIVGKYSKVCTPVDTKIIEKWFDNLCWGEDKIQKEKEDMVATGICGFTTEISADWSSICKIYDSAIARIRNEYPRAADLTMLGAHSSHSYQNGTNMYFVYDYKVNCKPEDELKEYHYPIHAIIIEETLRFGGSMAHHHGIGKYRNEWTEEEHGTSYFMLETLKKAFDPNGIMNKGTLYQEKRIKR
ncbi:MAG: FAD-binding oxidoreductase [Brevinema sp.]